MKNALRPTTKSISVVHHIIFLILFTTSAAHAQWTPSAMSKARYALAGTAAGTKAFFAGGDDEKKVLSTVDIYDATTNTWTIDSLSEPRMDLSSTSLGT